MNSVFYNYVKHTAGHTQHLHQRASKSIPTISVRIPFMAETPTGLSGGSLTAFGGEDSKLQAKQEYNEEQGVCGP